MATKARAEKIPEEDWASHKDEIVDVFFREGFTLPALVKYMSEKYDFTATYDIKSLLITSIL